jgi:cyclic pyranopterin phosphate synthase
MNVKKLLHEEASDAIIKEKLLQAFGSRAKDGFEAEKNRIDNPVSESMSTIGG